MTLMEGVGVVTQVLVAVGVVANVIQNIINGRKSDEIGRAVDTVHLATNSMKDELVSAVRKESFQAGKIDQASQEDSTKVTS